MIRTFITIFLVEFRVKGKAESTLSNVMRTHLPSVTTRIEIAESEELDQRSSCLARYIY